MKLTAKLIALTIAFTGPALAQTAPKAGDVWTNGKTYHCAGSRYYGTTKEGVYLQEKAAQESGAKGARGKTCAEAAAAKAKAAPKA